MSVPKHLLQGGRYPRRLIAEAYWFFNLNTLFDNGRNPHRAYDKGGSAGTSVGGSDSQEVASESLKGPIALAIEVLF